MEGEEKREERECVYDAWVPTGRYDEENKRVSKTHS
jgi:hypothetical protein